jgi:hypothetical protein
VLTLSPFGAKSAYHFMIFRYRLIFYANQTGRSVAFPGHPLGSGLTATAAKELGLRPGIPVGTSLIDAHAGGVGVMESVPDAESKADSQCWFICIFLKKSVLELYIHVL